ncbi:MAG: MFS transporter [Haloarculaceae archaeon]
MITLAGTKRRALAVVGVAELFAMTLWFSGSAVAPELTTAWNLTGTEAAWLTNAVQLGFVVSALGSADLAIADIVRPRELFATSAFVGAAATAFIAGAVNNPLPAVVRRFVTGVALAGVYPPGMKMMAAWFDRGRGLAIRVLVGAVTVGSAAPHLLRTVGGLGQPRVGPVGSAAIAALGGLLVLLYEEGPHQHDPAAFDPGGSGRILRDRGVLLANLGYFGHMFDLYVVWTWLPVYLVASVQAGNVANPEPLAARWPSERSRAAASAPGWPARSRTAGAARWSRAPR